jgi:peptide/nickel transport system permease protein
VTASSLSLAVSRPGRAGLSAAVIGPVLVLLALLVLAVFASVLIPHDPATQNLLARLQAPSATHLMGTDELGRDLFARVAAGARVSLAVGAGATLLGAIAGTAIGTVAAYARGWLDEGLMRVMDVLIAFPAVILAMAVVAIAGSSLFNVIWVLAVVQLPVFARLARSVVLTQAASEYVTAVRTLGVHPLRLIVAHLIPNSLAPLLAMAGLMAAGSILNEAALSFLGLGVVIPTPSWGNILAGGRGYLLVGAWWYTLFPGLAIFVTVLACNVLADAARDFFDPRLRASRPA